LNRDSGWACRMASGFAWKMAFGVGLEESSWLGLQDGLSGPVIPVLYSYLMSIITSSSLLHVQSSQESKIGIFMDFHKRSLNDKFNAIH
jgi:hypothetical protein